RTLAPDSVAGRIPRRQLSCARSGNAVRRQGSHDRRGECDLARWRRRLHRRVAAPAETTKPARRDDLARQAAAQHPRQRLAAGHRLWDACGGDRKIPATRTCPRKRWRQDQVACAVLSGELLDVVERGETCAVLWVFQRGLVPRRDGWLAGRKFAT